MEHCDGKRDGETELEFLRRENAALKAERGKAGIKERESEEKYRSRYHSLPDIIEQKQPESIMTGVRDLALALGTVRDLDEGLRLCLRTTLDLSGMDSGGVYLLDPADGSLRLAVQEGLPPDFASAVSFYPADSPNTLLVMNGKPMYSRICDVADSVPDTPFPKELQSLAVVPILHGDRVIGCFNLASRKHATFPPFLPGIAEALIAPIGNTIVRFQSEQAIREKEEHWRQITENMSDLVTRLDSQGNYVYVSPTFRKTLGYQPEELIGKKARDGIHPDEAEKAEIEIETMLLKGEGSVEYRYRHKDGSWRWIESTGRVLLNKGGRVEGAILGSRDITARKRAEEALRESESTLRSVFRAAPVGISFIGDRIILSVNDSLCETLGYAEQEIVGRNTRMLYPDDREYHDVDRILYAGVRKRGRASMETVMRKKNGTVIQVSMTAGILDVDNPSHGFVVTVQDITDRKQAEDEREHTLSILQATLESTEEAILVVSVTGALSVYNRQFLRIWDLSGDEILLMNDMSLLEYIVSRIHGGEQFRAQAMLYYEYPDIDGTGVFELLDGRILEWCSRPQRLGGEVVGRIWSTRDVTARNQLEQKFLQAQKMEIVGRLAGGVAHDFNNILTVINANAELPLMFMSPNDPYYEAFEEIHRAGERAANLTRQLLAFSRKQIIEPKVINLNQILLEMDKMFRRLIGAHIELKTTPEESLLAVEADPGQIEQVITNLVVNARDAMPAGGKLTLETKNLYLNEKHTRRHPDLDPGLYVLLTVSDTGVGMDEETISHIFEPFFTTKAKGSGTGLGLSTCYGIVKQSRGDIEVESAPGQGTTIRVYLPAIEDEAQVFPGNRSREVLPGGTEVVLLVEDDISIRELVARQLVASGYTVLSAANGDEALALVQRRTDLIHLLVTDVVMPLMGGRELAERLSALRPGIRILFMSGYTDDSIVHHGVLEEKVKFIHKPFSMTDFMWKIRETLEE